MSDYDSWLADAYGGDSPVSFDYQPIDFGGIDYGSNFDLGNYDDLLSADLQSMLANDVSPEAFYGFDPETVEPQSYDWGTGAGAVDKDTFAELVGNGLDISNVSKDDLNAALGRSGTFNAARDSQDANEKLGLPAYTGSTPTSVQIGDKTYSASSLPKPTAAGNKTATTGTNAATNGKKGDLLGTLIPMLLMMELMRGKSSGTSNARIPALTASRSQTPYTQTQQAPGYRPGQGGVSYFTPTLYEPKLAGGGIVDLARALAATRREQRQGLLRGRGDGVSDSIPAMIGQDQPARLARGEYVVDARTVAELGNGSTDAGAERLDEMRKRVHAKRKKAGVGQDSGAHKDLPA